MFVLIRETNLALRGGGRNLVFLRRDNKWLDLTLFGLLSTALRFSLPVSES